MYKYRKQVATVIAGAAIFLNMAVPVLADTTIQITGNGADSTNATVVNGSSNTTSITQNNTANVSNDVSSTATTGSNDANFNTGGSTTVSTGDANVTSNVSTTANGNVANTACCGAGNTDVLISGNGANSNNQVNPLSVGSSTTVKQNNTANISNDVTSTASTGKNDANQNTGGSVTVMTGDAGVTSDVTNNANENIAMIGSGNSGVPTASFKILGNGAGSNNYIKGDLGSATVIDQSNKADISNDIEASAKTGGNDANFNTGGDVTIDTGSASVENNVTNDANFNFASADCGCLVDLLAKIDGNGADTKNTISLDMLSGKSIGQKNSAYLDNNLEDVFAKTGYNDANSNTGTVTDPSDPTVMTGDSAITNNVDNTANLNVAGSGLSLPEGFPFGGVTVGFDWNSLLSWVNSHVVV